MNSSIVFLLLFSLASSFSAQSPSGSDSLRLDLIRIQTRSELIGSLVRRDGARYRSISAAIRRRVQPDCVGSPQPPPPPASLPVNGSFTMPINSGAYTGTGQYFVRFRVGTPAQTFVLVADTGSDLTWVDCTYRKKGRRSGSGSRGKRVFDADRSRSFHPIWCSSEMCKTQLPFSLTTCPFPSTPCAYDYGYSDGSTAQGFFANESSTITLSTGRKKKLKGLIVGCTASSVGSSFSSADGVIGLGYSNISFASRATALFGGKFSYCLMDHLSPKNDSAYLTFGPNSSLNLTASGQTELLIQPSLEPFYAVGVIGISVAGEVLKIPQSVWNVERGGGTILDSGTSLTVLTEPAYTPVMSALSQRLNGIPRVDMSPFDVCYNWTNVEEVTVPKLIIHFNGSAQFEPPAKSYLIDVAVGVKCLGFVSAPWPGVSTIGNIMQQEHIWEFDIRNQRLRFQPSMCI